MKPFPSNRGGFFYGGCFGGGRMLIPQRVFHAFTNPQIRMNLGISESGKTIQITGQRPLIFLG